MVKINLTQDILKILPLVKITNNEEWKNHVIVSGDLFWGGTVIENIMQAWGKFDEHIPGTDLLEEGRMWDMELEKNAWDTYEYICNNLSDIISIIFYTLPNVKEGVYTRKSRTPGIWEFKEFEK